MRPWKKLSAAVLLQDRWMHLSAHRCQLPNGIVLDPYYVVQEADWVHVLAVDAVGRVLLVRQYRYAADVVCTELPGGVIDAGETPLAAAQRELLEETGFHADHWAPAGVLYANPARQTNKIHIFVASSLSHVAAQRLDASEEIECLFLHPEEVMAAMDCGEFSQALHVSSYYRGIRACVQQPTA